MPRRSRSPFRGARWGAVVALATAVSAFALPAQAATTTAAAAKPAAPVRTIWTIGGTGASCQSAPDCGDGAAATAAPIAFPQAVTVAPDGSVYVADYGDSEIRRIDPSGNITVVAGDGTPCQAAPDCGDGGPATSAELAYPTGVALDSRGDLFIADAGDNEIREVTPTGTISRFAGSGADCISGDPCGDGGPATSAQLSSPDGVAVDSHGTVFIADTGDNEVRQVAPDGAITTIAGTGAQCTAAPACGDGGPASAAMLNFPEAVAVDRHGHLYIADDGDNEIRLFSVGRITRVAGTGVACAAAPACGDGGAARNAQLNSPQGVAVDSAGNVFVADWGDSEVREISTRGMISRIAGSGVQCTAAPACGEAQNALTAQLSSPHGVALDSAGDLYIADTYDELVRMVTGPGALKPTGRGTATSPALVVLGDTITRSQVPVRFLLSGAARASLWVRAGTGGWLLAARVNAAAGQNELIWNRRLGRRTAPRGRYSLALTLGSAAPSSTGALSIRL